MLSKTYTQRLILSLYADIIPECWAVYKIIEHNMFWSVIFINIDESYTFYITVSKFELHKIFPWYWCHTKITKKICEDAIAMLREQIVSKIVNPNVN